MEETNNHNSTVLKELSDIKASLAVNTNETANIKQRVTELQVDIKEIKNEYINRREFNETITTLGIPSIKKDVDDLKQYRWKLAGIVALAGSLGAGLVSFIGQLIVNFIRK